MSDADGDTEHVWPDDLEMGDRVEFDGHRYEVVGTAPGEASLERVDNDSYTAEVFRWAFTDAVGIELETEFEQQQFEKMVSRGDSNAE